MDRETERRTYPRYSRNPRRRAKNVVASDYSATSESVDTGDSGETTQDANRSDGIGSPELEGGAEQMASAKEITRAVFSSWLEWRQQALKESRVRCQNKSDPLETSPATPLISKGNSPAVHRPRREK